jgi:hypothetical protein
MFSRKTVLIEFSTEPVSCERCSSPGPSIRTALLERPLTYQNYCQNCLAAVISNAIVDRLFSQAEGEGR